MNPMAMRHALKQVGKPSGYATPAIDYARRALAGLSNGQLSFGYMINTNAWLLHDDISIENYRRFEVAYPLGCISSHPDRQSTLSGGMASSNTVGPHEQSIAALHPHPNTRKHTYHFTHPAYAAAPIRS